METSTVQSIPLDRNLDSYQAEGLRAQTSADALTEDFGASTAEQRVPVSTTAEAGQTSGGAIAPNDSTNHAHDTAVYFVRKRTKTVARRVVLVVFLLGAFMGVFYAPQIMTETNSFARAGSVCREKSCQGAFRDGAAVASELGGTNITSADRLQKSKAVCPREFFCGLVFEEGWREGLAAWSKSEADIEEVREICRSQFCNKGRQGGPPESATLFKAAIALKDIFVQDHDDRAREKFGGYTSGWTTTFTAAPSLPEEGYVGLFRSSVRIRPLPPAHWYVLTEVDAILRNSSRAFSEGDLERLEVLVEKWNKDRESKGPRSEIDEFGIRGEIAKDVLAVMFGPSQFSYAAAAEPECSDYNHRFVDSQKNVCAKVELDFIASDGEIKVPCDQNCPRACERCNICEDVTDALGLCDELVCGSYRSGHTTSLHNPVPR
jgi:hypothetical protein